VQAGGSTVLGFSFTGGSVPAGCGTLTDLSLSGDATVLSDIVFSDSDGNGFEVTYYEDDGGDADCDTSDGDFGVTTLEECNDLNGSWNENDGLCGDGVCDDVDGCIGVYDNCGECNGDGLPEGECDCDGNIIDECGVCGGSGVDSDNDGLCENDGSDDCIGNNYDCAGECNGSAVVDCLGNCNGTAILDECGVCDGGGISGISDQAHYLNNHMLHQIYH
jgi:hypothetical protein